MDIEINKNVRYNFTINVIDGGFFGLAMGLASVVTVLPLFVSTMTDSAVLIGLIPAIRTMGWQLPQILTANHVAHLRRYKPMVILMTIQERLPFLGLAAIAWFLPGMAEPVALWLTFGLLVWQGLGGGLTATAWQSMIAEIMPPRRRGVFFGAQAASADVLASGGAVLAGFMLDTMSPRSGFTLCFLLASVALVVSWIFLAGTREPEHSPYTLPDERRPAFWQGVGRILRCDANFRWFLLGRALLPFGTLAFAFYTVYAVRAYHASASVAGLMTGVFLAVQIVFNPLMGWLGDRWSHRAIIEIGTLAAVASAVLAAWAPGLNWFYLVFILAGIANVSFWTIGLAMTLEFGTPAERPAYISLANTLVAPSTIVAPLLGGWLADFAGYPVAFLASAVGGVIATLVFHMLVQNPRHDQSMPVPDTDMCPG